MPQGAWQAYAYSYSQLFAQKYVSTKRRRRKFALATSFHFILLTGMLKAKKTYKTKSKSSFWEMEAKLKVVKSARMSTVCRFCLWQYGIGNIELMGGGRWAMANGRLGASPKDNMCDSWRWLPRMITEITISGPRNKKKMCSNSGKWKG